MKTLEEKQKELEAYGTIGKTVMFGSAPIGKVIDEVELSSQGYKHCIQRLHQVPEARPQGGDEFAYRFCYYALPDSANKVFGQYAPVLSQSELRDLLRRAHERGWPIFP